MGRERIMRFDADILLDFRLGLSVGEVWRKYRNKPSNQRISKGTIYKLYNEWVRNGRQGELEYIGNKVSDGVVIQEYRMKEQK